MTKRASLLILAFAILLTISPLAGADRCILPISDADVYGPGQKAIVAWNGDVERLILSTDLYASADTKVLEILPLPSQPTVEIGQFESFQAVQQLMIANAPRALSKGLTGLEITFHEKVGAHDITVVRVTSVDDLVRFALDYAQKVGIGVLPAINRETTGILEDYLSRGFEYWVFDLVDIYSTMRSIEPIAYEFHSSSLYYPLKVSATAKGRADVTLYLITTWQITETEIPTKMRLAYYQSTEQVVQFQISSNDLTTIDAALSGLFLVADGPAAWFTAAKYEGDLNDLDFDLEIPRQSVTCRSIDVTTDRSEYRIGDSVKINVHFTHLFPECAEIEVLHSHEIRIQVRTVDGSEIQSWTSRTDSDLTETVVWRTSEAGSYVISAGAWWDGSRLEVEDQTIITVLSSTPLLPPYVVYPDFVQWLVYGVTIAVICILIGVGVAYLLLRSKSREESRAQQHGSQKTE